MKIWSTKLADNDGRFKKGGVPWNKGKHYKLSPEHIENIKRGHIGLFRDKKWRENIKLSHSGSKCHWWKGGISPENERVRKTMEYKHWRDDVFKRDNWTCQKCFTKGGILHPHHIKGFADYKELRFLIDNGITLCISCHKKVHKKVK